DHTTDAGLADMFERGALIYSNLNVPIPLGSLTGVQSFSGTWSSRKYTLLDRSSFLRIPGDGALRNANPVLAPEKAGSWSLSYLIAQPVWQDQDNQSRSVGLFGIGTINDGNPNPIDYLLAWGISGTGVLRCREHDSFGLSFFYAGLSAP